MPRRPKLSAAREPVLPALKGGVPARAGRVRLDDLTTPRMFVALGLSVALHLVVSLYLHRLPGWPLRGGALTAGQLAALTAGLIAMAAPAVYTVRAQASWRRPTSPLALAAGVCTAIGMVLGAVVLHKLAATPHRIEDDPREPMFWGALGAFALALACAGAAVIHVPLRRSRGWPLTLFGLVIPPWFGWWLWAFLYPMWFAPVPFPERTLPSVPWSLPYRFDPKWPPHAIRIAGDGRVFADRNSEVLLWDVDGPGREVLHDHLRSAAKTMRREPENPEDPTSTYVPAQALMIYADREVEFDRLLQVVQVCDEADVGIWKVDFVTLDSEYPWRRALWTVLAQPPGALPPESMRLHIESTEGQTRYRLGDRVTTDPAELGAFALAPMGPGVTWGQVTELLNLETVELGPYLYPGPP